MYKATLAFSKKGLMRYISHLDLMRTFSRALRRAQIPVKLSEGFSPHLKISIQRALKLGLESDNEQITVTLTEFLNPRLLVSRLNAQLPEGIRVREEMVF